MTLITQLIIKEITKFIATFWCTAYLNSTQFLNCYLMLNWHILNCYIKIEFNELARQPPVFLVLE